VDSRAGARTAAHGKVRSTNQSFQALLLPLRGIRQGNQHQLQPNRGPRTTSGRNGPAVGEAVRPGRTHVINFTQGRADQSTIAASALAAPNQMRGPTTDD